VGSVWHEPDSTQWAGGSPALRVLLENTH
jgi:hypothetical protein